MALERTYIIPLRKGFRKAPKYKRAKKAISTLKEFIKRHMKSDNIRIGRNLNKEIWKKGIKNPPHHVKVNLIKDDDGLVKAELFGFEFKEMTKEEREKAEKKKPKKEEKVERKKEEVKEEKEEEPEEEEVKEEKEVKEKEEIKVEKKEKIKEKPKKKVTKKVTKKPTKKANK